MRWRILGPVEVTVGGRVLGIRRPQQRGVLALLLLNADRLVTTRQITEALWADPAPASARTQVQVCVSQLRAALRPVGLGSVLTSCAGGYRLEVGDAGLDLAEFRAAVDQARAVAREQPAVAAERLRAGLALWRGPALTGASGAFVESAATALAEQRLTAYEELADLELATGRHGEVVRTLSPLVDAHPLRERLVGQLMLGLAGCGQQAQALRLYTGTRARLVDELGVEPAAELAAVHLRVLRQETTVPLAGAAPAAPVDPAVP
ncbi:MAG TPA: AfsR/SARP family transcriptional regulator, partial [Micromonospora sp.]